MARKLFTISNENMNDAALFDDTVDVIEAVEMDNVSTNFTENINDINENINVVSDSMETASELENLQTRNNELLDGTKEIETTDVIVSQEMLRLHGKKLGIDLPRAASSESIYDARQQLAISNEGIGDVLNTIWETIVKVINGIWEKIKGFFRTIGEWLGLIDKKIDKTEEDAKAAEEANGGDIKKEDGKPPVMNFDKALSAMNDENSDKKIRKAATDIILTAIVNDPNLLDKAISSSNGKLKEKLEKMKADGLKKELEAAKKEADKLKVEEEISFKESIYKILYFFTANSSDLKTVMTTALDEFAASNKSDGKGMGIAAFLTYNAYAEMDRVNPARIFSEKSTPSLTPYKKDLVKNISKVRKLYSFSEFDENYVPVEFTGYLDDGIKVFLVHDGEMDTSGNDVPVKIKTLDRQKHDKKAIKSLFKVKMSTNDVHAMCKRLRDIQSTIKKKSDSILSYKDQLTKQFEELSKQVADVRRSKFKKEISEVEQKMILSNTSKGLITIQNFMADDIADSVKFLNQMVKVNERALGYVTEREITTKFKSLVNKGKGKLSEFASIFTIK